MVRLVCLLSVASLILVACSGSGDDNDAGSEGTSSEAQAPTEALTPIPPEPTSTAPEPTATNEPTTPEPESPTLPPTAEATATEAATATESPPSATPTEIPLPQGGAELLVSGSPVLSMFSGSVNGLVLYAITEDSLNQSLDGGNSWTEVGAFPGGEPIVSSTSSEILYTGDRSSCGRGVSFYAFNRSFDGGQTWETIEASMDRQPMYAFEDAEGDFVYGTACGLSISADGGTSWTQYPDLAGEEVFSISADQIAPDNLIYVVGVTEGGTGRLFVLDITDRTTPDLNGAITQFFGDAGVGISNGRIVVATSSRTGVSDDGGDTWTWSRDGLENATFSVDPLSQEIPEDEQSIFFRFNIVEIDPANNNAIWIAGNNGAFRSIDGGLTWVQLGDASSVDSLVVSNATDRVFISSEGGTRVWTLAGD